MNFEEFRSFAESKINIDWTQTLIEFENVPESTALTTAKNNKTPWIRFIIRDGEGKRQTIGSNNPLFRYVGNIIVQIFVAQNTGTKTARELADAMTDIWRGYTGEPCLEFRTSNISVIGETEGWFQINVSIPFKNDELT